MFFSKDYEHGDVSIGLFIDFALINEYNFNFAKSTLLKRFICPNSELIKSFEVNILEKPFNILLNFYKNNPVFLPKTKQLKPKDYIVLPLYNPRNREVEKKSALNHWNANGRKRNENEVYIPIPSWIHKVKVNFFDYNTDDYKTEPFTVLLPNGEKLSMRVCQSGGKALMSNPNNLLGRWILRDVLNIPVGKLVTRKLLDIIGIDSIKEPLIKARRALTAVPATFSSCRKLWLDGNLSKDRGFIGWY